MNRISLLLLNLLMVSSVFGADLTDLTYTTSSGEVQITGCETSASGTLVIPDAIGGDPVTSIGDSAFVDCSSLTSIVFEGLVAPTLGEDVFLNVASEATITYPFGATGYSNPFGGLPASAASDATWFDAAVELGDGWRWFDWFGSFYISNVPWIFHAEHGWLWTLASGSDSIYLWDEKMGSMLWTSENVYPALYRFSDNSWLFYEMGSKDPRWFFNWLTGVWESIGE